MKQTSSLHPQGTERTDSREIRLGSNEGMRTVKLRQATVIWRRRRTPAADALPS
jgi:hypothetical protein